MSADDRTQTVDASGGARTAARADAAARAALLLIFSEARTFGDCVFVLPADTRAASIGRQSDQHVYLEDRGLSREHASLARGSDGRFVLRDLGSHNGTYVDGERVDGERALDAGAIVRCGSTLLMLVDDATPYAGWPKSALDSPLSGGAAMQRARAAIELLAKQTVDVLVRGESGVGKEVAAQLLHARSERGGALVSVNCAALPQALFEAELFGAARGAYTGADEARRGLFEQAHGGTLFLDEVGELPLSLQPKLLRAVESGVVRRVGGDSERRVDVRIVAATNRDLAAEAQAGRFRADLYYRLRASEITLPPLRTRREDIALLAVRLLSQLEGDLSSKRLAALAVERLCLHHWPGNVRELRHVIFEGATSASLAGSERIEPTHLREDVVVGGRSAAATSDQHDDDDDDDHDDDETARVARALRACGGHVGNAAAELGISRSRLYRMLAARGINAKDYR
ncbi:MAG: sigma 54-interacting transcriptional regulator [Myxococcales bacterium]|nr:sigma 54-interacting transcriptional regulator [Myxococcales bacterium]